MCMYEYLLIVKLSRTGLSEDEQVDVPPRSDDEFDVPPTSGDQPDIPPSDDDEPGGSPELLVSPLLEFQ